MLRIHDIYYIYWYYIQNDYLYRRRVYNAQPIRFGASKYLMYNTNI